MTSILVGVDGTRRGDRAVAWAARQAEREGASLALLSVIDSDMVRTFGVASDAVRDAVQSVLDETAQSVAAQHPDLEIKTTIVEGEVVSSMANAANLHDMIVLGSHHGATIGETMGGAKGLRVSVLTKVPTVVVPADWDLDTENEGVMVGVGPDNVSENAIAFGVHQAEMLNQELVLVSAWGLPPLLTRPAEVMGVWDQALSEYEEILYMPISSGLSGSYGTARVLAEEEPYQGRVYPVDHGQVATPLHQMILDALEMIKKGYSAVKIREILEKARDRMMIFICVETLEYLKRGGRITPAAAALGTVLQIKPVLKLEVGKLDSYKKCHGFLKARRTAIEAMKQLIETKFQAAYQAGALRLFAASSADEEETEGWIAEIKRIFPGMEVMCDNLSLGVSCHTGPGALGIGCSVCPEFEDAEE